MEASALRQRRGLRLTRSRKLLCVLGDEQLVEQLRGGNDAAFEVIWDRHHRAILSFCRHMLGSREEAEDAVQQTFINAHKGLLEGQRHIKLRPWLYAIARNRCLSMLRVQREQTAALPDISVAGLSQEVEQRAELREMLADLRDLPDEQREALILSELGDLSHAEIARVIGVDAMKVKSLVFQARSALIENRGAREIPCEQIRETLATVRGGALRRAPLRRHLAQCEGCREFRDEVRRQRSAMAAVLPVIPTLGLKESALGALGIGGGGAAGGGLTAGAGAAGAGASGGGAGIAGLVSGGASGGVGALISSSAAKVAAAMLIAGGTVGGGVAITHDGASSTPPGPEPAVASDSPAGAQGGSGHMGSGGQGSGGVQPGGAQGGGGAEDDERAARKRARQRAGTRHDDRGGPHGSSGRGTKRSQGGEHGKGRRKSGARGLHRGRGRGRGRARGQGPRDGSGSVPDRPPSTTREPKPPRPPRLPEVDEGTAGGGDRDGKKGDVEGMQADGAEPLPRGPSDIP